MYMNYPGACFISVLIGVLMVKGIIDLSIEEMCFQYFMIMSTLLHILAI